MDPQTTCQINLSMKTPNRLMGKTFLPSEKWKSFTFFLLFYTFLSISDMHVESFCWYFRTDGENPAHKHSASI